MMRKRLRNSENYFEKRAFFISSAEMGRALFGFSKLETGQSRKKQKKTRQ